MAATDLNLHWGSLELITLRRRIADSIFDLVVLKALSSGPRYATAIAAWIREIAGQRLPIEENALYASLQRMEQLGWLESEWGVSAAGEKARYYQLTSQGRQQLSAEADVWNDVSGAVFKILRTD